MTVWLLLVGLVYAIVAVFLLGIGIGDEMSFRNPDYWLVIGVAVGWPLVLPYAVCRRWVCGG